MSGARTVALIALWALACGEPTATPAEAGLDAATSRLDAAGGAPPDAQRAHPGDSQIPDAEPGEPALRRVENRTCALPEVGGAGTYELVEAFPGRDFERPLWFGFAPGDPERRFVVEQGGEVLVFGAHGQTPARTFLRREVSREGNEEGLLGLAFHPDYARNGRLFIYYSAAAPRRSILSELRVDPADPERVLPNSERVLLTIPQPYPNHNGGDLRFDATGALLVAVGDGGAGGDPQDNAQRPQTLLGGVLRLDVDGADARCDTAYAVPPDNPFAGEPCAGGRGRREVWAWGLRNPWRLSVDRLTGAVWAGDVGQDRWERVLRLRGGGNYGWRQVEGPECFTPGCDLTAYEPAVHTYGRTAGRSITGGLVYRGAALPELVGAYLFADFVSGRVWAIRPGPDGRAPRSERLVDSGLNVSSFGEDPDGELYLVAFDGHVHRLRRAPDAARPPLTLGATGCFDEVASRRWAPGVIPYRVTAPAWLDGALAERAFALPEGGRIGWRPEGPLDLPRGAVLLKTVLRDDRPLETRILHRGLNGWRAYNYVWRADGTEADLSLAGGDAPDGTWRHQSGAECGQCHAPRAHTVLGFTAAQLQGVTRWDGPAAPQLAALQAAGYVEGGTPGSAWPDPADAEIAVERRARTWLAAQCGACHRPAGFAELDLRATTALSDTGACDAPPTDGDLGLGARARILAPGRPELSVLLARVSRRGAGQMPPLGTRRVDEAAVALLRAWIAGLASCP